MLELNLLQVAEKGFGVVRSTVSLKSTNSFRFWLINFTSKIIRTADQTFWSLVESPYASLEEAE